MNKKAFTLIELLIVIGIIAILASAVIVAINPGQQFAAARDATRSQHINSLHNSLSSYQVANQGWGDLEITDELTEICNTNEVDPGNCGDLADISDLVDDEHINQLPVDPQAEGDGTEYFIKEGSILVADRAETRFIGVGITEDEYSEGRGDGEAFACGDDLDYEGYSYATAEIGDQCWFAEDLRYDDGCTENAWDDEDACDDADCDGGDCGEDKDYGNLLYQWDAAMDGSTTEGAQGICPDGWHIPTHDEFTDLERQVCSDAENSDCETEFPYDTSTTGKRGTDEGDRMKDPDEEWCNDSSTPPCGTSGFLALPGGYRDTSGSLNFVGSENSGNYWWSSTSDSEDAWYRDIGSSFSDVRRFSLSQASGYSVRCLRDEN